MITALTTGVVPEPGQVAEFAFSKYQAAPLRGAGPGVRGGLRPWGGPGRRTPGHTLAACADLN